MIDEWLEAIKVLIRYLEHDVAYSHNKDGGHAKYRKKMCILHARACNIQGVPRELLYRK